MTYDRPACVYLKIVGVVRIIELDSAVLVGEQVIVVLLGSNISTVFTHRRLCRVTINGNERVAFVWILDVSNIFNSSMVNLRHFPFSADALPAAPVHMR